MNIKGPGAPPPIDRDSLAIPATRGSRLTADVTQTPSPSVQLRLSPSLFTLGQTLDVIVAKIERDAMWLLVQNTLTDAKGQNFQLQLRSPDTLQAQVGQRLTLQVSALRDHIPTLKVLNQLPTNPTAPTVTPPPSIPVRVILDSIAEIRQQTSLYQPLPPAVQKQLDVVWRALPEASQLSKVNSLHQALQYSGAFLESQLLKTQQGARLFPAMDLRTNLLRLATALRHTPPSSSPSSPTASTPLSSTPPLSTTNQGTAATPSQNASLKQPALPTNAHDKFDPNQAQPQQRTHTLGKTMMLDQFVEQLLQQTEGALSRILNQQLNMVNPEGHRQTWMMELPVKHQNEVDMFDIRIEEDQEQTQQQDDAQHPWSVMLAFDLAGLGPMRVNITYQQGQISTQWWAERANTVDLFHEHMARLEHRLEHAGITVKNVQCQKGLPDNTAPSKNTTTPIYSDVNLDELV